MIALVRAVSPRLGDCELTHVVRRPIDVTLARAQHTGYVAALRGAGARIGELPPLPEAADGVFVEDTAIVLDELALVLRPGVASRRVETPSVAQALAAHRPVYEVSGDARIEGGDVLRIGRTLYVGQSGRTDARGVAELIRLTQPFGYTVRPVTVRGCLHLKTACTFAPPNVVVLNPAWVDAGVFRDFTVIAVAAEEPFGANTLTVGTVTLVSAASPQTERRLQGAGVVTRRLELAELEKAEAGLTCLSLVFAAGVGAK